MGQAERQRAAVGGGILLGPDLPTVAAMCFPRKEIFFFGFMLLITKNKYGNVL